MKASVILIRCPKSKAVFGARTQQMSDGDWWRTWAFAIDENRARREGYDQEPVKGNLYCTDEYPGCPYCETKSFVQCNKCGKLNCWNGETVLDCQWCENHMDNIVEATDKFIVSGGDI